MNHPHLLFLILHQNEEHIQSHIILLGIEIILDGVRIILRKYKLKPDRQKLDAKETSLAMVDNKNEQMMTSSAAVPSDQ